MVETETKV